MPSHSRRARFFIAEAWYYSGIDNRNGNVAEGHARFDPF